MRQPWLASSHTMHGSPLTPKSLSFFWRSKITPRRVQVSGILNLPGSCFVSDALSRMSCAWTLLVKKMLPAHRAKRAWNSAVIVYKCQKVLERSTSSLSSGGDPQSPAQFTLYTPRPSAFPLPTFFNVNNDSFDINCPLGQCPTTCTRFASFSRNV